ncbi:MAG: prepilin-type N-terminal cleavage/methylation domain-containing protein, partial [Aquificaceae bacterium]|nr:prepilin-type N-terminal cleavage/methylation domain-containing protein [Aquificaceae bacterium]
MQIFLGGAMKKGFTIIEFLSAVMISLIIMASFVGIYTIANRVFLVNKELTLLKESTKEGIYGLEWFFQRWGVGVPCVN